MEWEEWRQIVTRLNASYPEQQIESSTALEWYDEVCDLDAGDVWLAVRAIRRTEHFRPNLGDLLAGVDLHRRDMAEQHRAQESATRQLEARRRGVPMPPETKQALEILKEVSRPDTPDDRRAEAAQMAHALANQLDSRMTARPETVMDATRTCPGCADSPQAGRIVGPPDTDARGVQVATLIPCPDCTSRHDAWRTGTLHARPRAKEPQS